MTTKNRPPRVEPAWAMIASKQETSIRDVNLKSRMKRLYEMGAKLPPVVRWPLGFALIAGGIFGVVVPILGLWMVPLGLILIALDIPPLRERITAWFERGSQNVQ